MKMVIPFLLMISFLSSQSKDHKSELCTHTVAGDFYLKSVDTLKEDVSVSGGNAMIDGVIDGDLAVMGGSVIINGTIDGGVAVFGGKIENYGNITDDAAVAGGSVKNMGIIGGNIAVAGGTVELDSGSVVEGDIAIIGGSVDRSNYAKVNGKVTALDIGKLDRIMPKIEKLFQSHERQTPVRRAFIGFASIATVIIMYLLSLLSLLLFPRATEKIADKIKNNIWIGIALGIGMEIAITPLIILFTISIIGIPIIPAFVLAIFIGAIFGISALSLVVGERICLSLNWQIKSKIGLYTVGWLALMIVLIIGILVKGTGFLGTLVWILGIAIVYVASTIGMGSVVYAIAKREK